MDIGTGPTSFQRYLCTRDLRHNVRALVKYSTSTGGFNGPSGAPGEGEGGAGEPPPEGGEDVGQWDGDEFAEWELASEMIPPGDDAGGGEGGTDAPSGGGGTDSPQGGGSSGSTTVIERYLYKPYGERIAIQPRNYAVISGDDDPSNSIPSPLCPMGFQGLRHEMATFLIHARNTPYDAITGRWLTHDPLGYANGMNLYEAFGSNPTANIDPFGLESGDPIDDFKKKLADFLSFKPSLRSSDRSPTAAVLGVDPTAQALKAAKTIAAQPNPLDAVQPYILPTTQVLQGAGGAGQIVVGVSLAFASDGSLAPLGLVIYARGVDNLSAASIGLYEGRYVPTTTNVVLMRLTGSPTAATVSEFGIDFVTGLAAEGASAELSGALRPLSTSLSDELAEVGLLRRISSRIQSSYDSLAASYSSRGVTLGTNFSFGPVSEEALIARMPSAGLVEGSTSGEQMFLPFFEGDVRLPGTRVQLNRAAGNAVRDLIASLEAPALTEQTFTTVGGVRRVDVLKLGDELIAIESKVGRTGLGPRGSRVRQELARDWWLVRQGQVDRVRWVFTPSEVTERGGPSQPLLDKLRELGFEVQVKP
jgi:RHS repeat-associated protein